MLRKYKNELSKKKYAPLKRDVINEMVMEYHRTADAALLDVIITTNMRLVLFVINKCFPLQIKEDIVMEWISVGNESLVNSVNQYKEIEIDFSLYAYYNVRNAIISYSRVYGNVIRSITTDGKTIIPHFDDLQDEHTNEEESYNEFDVNEIIQIINELNIKEEAKEMFIYFWGLVDGKKKTYADCSRKYDMTLENCRQKVNRVMEKIKENENILKKLSKIMSF